MGAAWRTRTSRISSLQISAGHLAVGGRAEPALSAERVAEAILDVAADLLARGEPPSMADIAEGRVVTRRRQGGGVQRD